MSANRTQSKVQRKRKLINRKRRIQYALADRTRGLGPGGIGAMHLLAGRAGLIESIDRRLQMQMPVDNLLSTWAYVVMPSLAWSLKSWFALVAG